MSALLLAALVGLGPIPAIQLSRAPAASASDPPASARPDEPTTERALQVVGDWFGDDEARARARARLEAWGTTCLPALRELAHGEFPSSEQHALTC